MRPSDAILLAQLRAEVAANKTRQVRLDAGLSLAELGSACGGIPASTISRWERGKQVPRGPAALRYARLLERLRVSPAGVAS